MALRIGYSSMAEHDRSPGVIMKKQGKKPAAGGVSFESLEGRVLLSGVVREVSGTVFHDLNTNRVQDAGEAPFAGVTIYVDVNQNGKLDDGELATTSDANGHYSLSTDALLPMLAVVRPAGWVLVANFESDLTPDLRNFPLGTAPVVKGTVFEDADADYFTEGGLTPRSGVSVFLDRNQNGVPDDGEEKAVSDADGNYEFDDLPSRAIVRAAPVDGWSQENPISSSDVFSYRSKTISGMIFKDLNRNGVRDEGDAAFAGVVITATHEKVFGDGSRIVVVPPDPYITYPKGVSDDTEADGSFVLHDVPIISNQLVISIYDWYLTTSADDASNPVEIGLAHPSNLSSDPTGTLRGVVYNDLNHNGIMDAGWFPLMTTEGQRRSWIDDQFDYLKEWLDIETHPRVRLEAMRALTRIPRAESAGFVLSIARNAPSLFNSSR